MSNHTRPRRAELARSYGTASGCAQRQCRCPSPTHMHTHARSGRLSVCCAVRECTRGEGHECDHDAKSQRVLRRGTNWYWLSRHLSTHMHMHRSLAGELDRCTPHTRTEGHTRAHLSMAPPLGVVLSPAVLRVRGPLDRKLSRICCSRTESMSSAGGRAGSTCHDRRNPFDDASDHTSAVAVSTTSNTLHAWNCSVSRPASILLKSRMSVQHIAHRRHSNGREHDILQHKAP